MRLGKTNLEVNKNGFGALPIQRRNMADSVEILRHAYENGINFYVVWSRRYTAPHADGKWGEEFIDLSEFAGKNMYIGFLHYDCDGFTANGIRIDNVELMSDGVSVPEKTISFDVYPNPAENQLVISSDEKIENVTVVAMNGVVVYEGVYNNDGIDVSKLSSGVYFVNIKKAM